MENQVSQVQIKNLDDFIINDPYEVLVDVGYNDEWHTGMNIKYKGKDVVLISVKEILEWKKLTEAKNPLGYDKEDRRILKFTIIDL